MGVARKRAGGRLRAGSCAERFDLLLGAELEQVQHEVGVARVQSGVFPTAARLFGSMVKNDSFDEFLTLPAYNFLP